MPAPRVLRHGGGMRWILEFEVGEVDVRQAGHVVAVKAFRHAVHGSEVRAAELQGGLFILAAGAYVQPQGLHFLHPVSYTHLTLPTIA